MITGYYADAMFVDHGYLRLADGTLILFDPPASVFTFPQSINNAGAVVGSYDAASIRRGFLRDPSGGFTVFQVPGAIVTSASGINSSGVVAGNYGDGDNSSGFVMTCGDQPTYQLRYLTNLDKGDSFVTLSNAGTLNGFDPAGRICANVYTFDPAEELISCCSCMVTPNGLNTLSARNDLISNTLTPGTPTSVTIKLLASVPGPGNVRNASSPNSTNLVRGLRAWATTLHANTSTIATRYQSTETPFSTVELSDTELSKLTTFCGFIQANGSGFGICKSCRAGALGAGQK